MATQSGLKLLKVYQKATTAGDCQKTVLLAQPVYTFPFLLANLATMATMDMDLDFFRQFFLPLCGHEMAAHSGE